DPGPRSAPLRLHALRGRLRSALRSAADARAAARRDRRARARARRADGHRGARLDADPARAGGERDGLAPPAAVQLAADRADVRVDGLRAASGLRRDVLRARTLREVLED